MSGFGTESVALSKIAIPLVAAYVAELAMVLVTQVIVGRLGYVELGAVGLASHVSFELLLVSMGLLSVVGVLIAEAQAADDPARAGFMTRQGLIQAGLLAVPCTLLVFYLPGLLRFTGQEDDVLTVAGEFLGPFAVGVPAVFAFAVLRSFMAATSRAMIVMVISVIAVVVHAFLTLGLVHGFAGLPAMGVAGAGWSITIINWAMVVALALYISRRRGLRRYGVFDGSWKFDRSVQHELFWLGLPVSGLVLLESGLFMAVAILSGVLGAATLAATEVLLSWVSFAYVFALGIAEAAMVRVAYGNSLSRKTGQASKSQLAGWTAFGLGAGVALVLVVVPLMFPVQLINAFLDPGDSGYRQVSEIVLGLLLVVMVFQLFDGMQAIAARSLRALKDTLAPLWMAAFGYWVIGIGGGYYLCFVAGLGVSGLWYGLAGGLSVTAVLLTLRFHVLTR